MWSSFFSWTWKCSEGVPVSFHLQMRPCNARPSYGSWVFPSDFWCLGINLDLPRKDMPGILPRPFLLRQKTKTSPAKPHLSQAFWKGPTFCTLAKSTRRPDLKLVKAPQNRGHLRKSLPPKMLKPCAFQQPHNSQYLC